jgi:hypothetical protein
MRQVSEPPRFRHEGQDDIRNGMYHQHVRHEVSADVIAGQGVEQRSAGYGHLTEQVRPLSWWSIEGVTLV